MKIVLRLAAALTVALFTLPAYADSHADAQKALQAGNFEVAMLEWRPLAQKGDPAAQTELGHLYAQGKGVETNFEEAAKLYQSAAENNYHPAFYYHGLFLLKGLGQKEAKPAEATMWLKKAALASTENDAPYLLGRLYKRGQGVKADLVEAYKWFTIGSKQGMRQASINLQIVKGHMTADALIKAQAEVNTWLKNNR